MTRARHTIAEIVAAVRECGGDVSAAATQLGITRDAIYQRARRDEALAAGIAAARSAVTPRRCPRCHGAGVLA